MSRIVNLLFLEPEGNNNKHKLLFSKRMTKELFVALYYSSDDVWILYNQGTATFGKKSDIYKKGN